MIARFAGVTYAEADEKRRALGDVEGMAETGLWFFPRALARGYSPPVVERIWKVLEAFASFGFCKAHAAAFALPDLPVRLAQGALAGALPGRGAHPRPGHVPQAAASSTTPASSASRVLGLDVNASEQAIRRRAGATDTARSPATRSGSALAEVKGISAAEVDRIVAARPYHSLTDFWHRARCPGRSRAAGAGRRVRRGLRHRRRRRADVRRRGTVTRRDLLLQVAELDRHARAVERPPGRPRPRARRRPTARPPATTRATDAAARNSSDPVTREAATERHPLAAPGSGRRPPPSPGRPGRPPRSTSVQLTLDLGDEPAEGEVTGLPEMTAEERMRAELEILGLDASRHVVDSYADFLDAPRHHPQPRPARAGAARPSCWSPGSRWPPRPRRSGPGAGSSS